MGHTFFAIDSGRSLVKGKTDQMEDSFIHAFAKITETEWKQESTRDNESQDVIKVNGIPYVIGDKAIVKGFQPRTVSAQRYEAGYYGTLAAAMLFRLYKRDVKDIFLYGSHAPVDIDYRRDLIIAAKGKFTVEDLKGNKYTYQVTEARGFDEPVGGVMNRILNDSGHTHSDGSPIKNGATIVFDVGGQSVDVAVLENGKPDYLTLMSELGGTILIEQSMIRQIRSEHQTLLKSTGWLRLDRIRTAIRTGKFDAGGYGELDVKHIVEEATTPVLKTLSDLLGRHGGVGNFNNILLTGGGCGLLYDRIRKLFNIDAIEKRLNRKYLYLAEEQIDQLHMANVRGGFKMLKMFEWKGALK